MTEVSGTKPVSWFDDASPEDAAEAVEPICASPRWSAALLAGRPFGSSAAMNAASEAALDCLDWPDLEQALSAHPRIGERAVGDSTHAQWSRQEQSGAAGVDGGTRGTGDPGDTGDTGEQLSTAEQLRSANAEYEEHFGFVFLICATGKDAGEILGQLRTRMRSNTVEAEHEVVRAELKEIVALRLGRAFR